MDTAGDWVGYVQDVPTQVLSGFTVHLLDASGGSDGVIFSTQEAVNVLSGNVDDGSFEFAVDVTTVETVVNFGSPNATFSNPVPYPDETSDTPLDDLEIRVTTDVHVPEGEWTNGFGSNGGVRIRLSDITIDQTFNESGSTTDGDGELFYQFNREHGWTRGTFSVGAEGITTSLETILFHRKGEHSFGLAIREGQTDEEPSADAWTLLTYGALRWQVQTKGLRTPSRLEELRRSWPRRIDQFADTMANPTTYGSSRSQ